MLVLERRDQIGGACTLERPFGDDYVISPCAYVVGLLDELVIDELELAPPRLSAVPADPQLWCPFEDGTSFAEYLDDERTAAHLRANGFGEADVRGVLAYEQLFDRIRLRLRHGEAGDSWLGVVAEPRARSSDARRRRGDDRGRLRGADRRRRSSATSTTSACTTRSPVRA